MTNYWLVFGLIVNAIGATLLIFFTSPGLYVSQTGEQVVGFFIKPPPEQRAANRCKYSIYKWGFRVGFVLLAVGFALQLIAALLA